MSSCLPYPKIYSTRKFDRNLSTISLSYHGITDIQEQAIDGRPHDMPPPRPASGDTMYVMYAYGQVTITVCPCWPASTTNQSGLVTLTFDLLTLKVVSESRVTWAIALCQF